jgi:acyl carrier protein
VAPRTSVEQTIAAVWSEVLDIQPVGAHDNLFELGGDSLLAAHIAYRIRERLLVEVPVHEVLEHPTVATLATRLEAMHAGGGRSTSAGALDGVEGLAETGAGATLGGGQ